MARYPLVTLTPQLRGFLEATLPEVAIWSIPRYVMDYAARVHGLLAPMVLQELGMACQRSSQGR